MVVVVGRERGGHDNARGGGEGDVAVDDEANMPGSM
jgi:hypothetical protein